MTTNEIIAQVVAGVTCAVACSSYFAKNKYLYLLLQLVVNILFGVQYALLGALSGVVSNAVSCVKYIYIMVKDRFNKDINTVELIIFTAISIVVGVGAIVWGGTWFIEGWVSIIPIINSVAFTYAVCQNNKIVLRGVVIGCCTLWTVYDFMVGAYVSAAYVLFEMIFAVVTLVKIIKQSKNSGGNINEKPSDN